MIALVTGPPGAGKTFYAIRKLADELEKGKIVATNVPMEDDWHVKLANRHPLRWVIPGRRRSLQRKWSERIFYTDDLSEIFRLRLEGRGESRGVVVLDEAHNWMNARMWRDDQRAEVIRWFTLHRKLGWDVYLVTQDPKNIDRQVRDLFEYHVTLQNLRRFKVLGVPLTPFNLFLAIWRWHSAGGSVVKREAYRLNWQRKLYDTYGLAGGLDLDTDDAIWLPRPPDERGRPAAPPPPPAPSPASDTSRIAAVSVRPDAEDSAS